MNNTPTVELEAQRAVLLRQLRQAGPLVEGSIAMVARKCGSPGCPCAQGVVKHQAMILCKKVNGRSVATYVPKALWSQVREWNAEHKKIKRVLKDLSAIGEQIIRHHVGEQRRGAQRPALRLLEEESTGGR
jgi:Na+-translocating ferredoxin:NAD+ oxidoreductase RNF subunit RnfB